MVKDRSIYWNRFISRLRERFSSSEWGMINQRINACKRLADSSERLACLIKLWEEYRVTDRDGMVAYALGEELENQGRLQEALYYYEEAERRFPKQEWKDRARSAIFRVKSKIESEKRPSLPEVSKLLEYLDPETTLFVVSCTKQKIWDEEPDAPPYVPARYAYRGDTFMRAMRFFERHKIEARGFRWIILSAKYGFIEPWHPIGNYDVTFHDERTGPISDDTLYSQVMYQERWGGVRLKDFRVICCFCSQTYMDKIIKSFRDTGAKIIDGFRLEKVSVRKPVEPVRKVSVMSRREPPKAIDFQMALQEFFSLAESRGEKYIDITSGELHRYVGGYPGPNHRMPVCCDVMRRMMQAGDKILYEPPKGKGATLKIRYYLPRLS